MFPYFFMIIIVFDYFRLNAVDYYYEAKWGTYFGCTKFMTVSKTLMFHQSIPHPWPERFLVLGLQLQVALQ